MGGRKNCSAKRKHLCSCQLQHSLTPNFSHGFAAPPCKEKHIVTEFCSASGNWNSTCQTMRVEWYCGLFPADSIAACRFKNHYIVAVWWKTHDHSYCSTGWFAVSCYIVLVWYCKSFNLEIQTTRKLRNFATLQFCNMKTYPRLVLEIELKIAISPWGSFPPTAFHVSNSQCKSMKRIIGVRRGTQVWRRT